MKRDRRQIQSDWLDYWFKPKVEVIRVRNRDYLNTLAQCAAAGDWVRTVVVFDGGYELTIERKTDAARHEGMAGKSPRQTP